MRKWFLGIFPQMRCGCILEPELLNGERVSVLTTQSNNVVVVGGVSSRVCSVRKSCALLPGLTLGGVYRWHTNPVGSSFITVGC